MYYLNYHTGRTVAVKYTTVQSIVQLPRLAQQQPQQGTSSDQYGGDEVWHLKSTTCLGNGSLVLNFVGLAECYFSSSWDEPCLVYLFVPTYNVGIKS